MGVDIGKLMGVHGSANGCALGYEKLRRKRPDTSRENAAWCFLSLAESHKHAT